MSTLTIPRQDTTSPPDDGEDMWVPHDKARRLMKRYDFGPRKLAKMGLIRHKRGYGGRDMFYVPDLLKPAT